MGGSKMKTHLMKNILGLSRDDKVYGRSVDYCCPTKTIQSAFANPASSCATSLALQLWRWMGSVQRTRRVWQSIKRHNGEGRRKRAWPASNQGPSLFCGHKAASPRLLDHFCSEHGEAPQHPLYAQAPVPSSTSHSFRVCRHAPLAQLRSSLARVR